MSGLRRNPKILSDYLGTVTITNSGNSAITGPLTVVIAIRSGNAQLVNGDGFTCNIQPQAAWFVKVNTATLEPSQAVQRTLRFRNRTGEKFDVKFSVYGGAGSE